MKKTFTNTGSTFSAFCAAISWLRVNGYSYGSTDGRSSRVAIQKGGYTLPQKVHNFNRADFARVDGWMTSCDYREGDVMIEVKTRE